MNLFQLASRGIDLDALPDESPPERAPLAFEPTPKGSRFAVPQELDAAFAAAGDEYGVDPDVLRAMAFAESRFRPDVISGEVKSRTGAAGLMQFMPGTAERFGINPLDPVESIFGAAAYMRANLERFGGDYGKAVAAYNWGENRKAYGADDWKDRLPAETQGYLNTVFGAADELKLRAPKDAPPVKPPPKDAAEPAAKPAIPDRSWSEAFGDSTKSLAQGILDVASLPGVAYSAATGDYDTGYLNAIKGTQEVLQDQKSPAMQARAQALQEKLKTAEGWREKLAVGGIETLADPTLLADTLLRSAPGMAAGGLAGRAAGALVGQAGNAAMSQGLSRGAEALLKTGVAVKNAAPAIASATAVGTSAATQGASVAKETFDELMKLPAQAFSAEDGFAQLVKQHGEDGAKAIIASAAANRALAVATAGSVASMKLVPGGDAIEKMFLPAALKGTAREAAKAASANVLTKPLTQGMQGSLIAKAAELLVQGGKAGALESLSEGVEEASGAMAKGLELSRAGQGVSLGEMMGEAGGQGAAAGLAMGKVAGMQEAYASRVPTVENQPTVPKAPVVAPAGKSPVVETGHDVAAQILQAEQATGQGGLAAELEALRARSAVPSTESAAVEGGLAAELQALRARSIPQEAANAPQRAPSTTEPPTQATSPQAADIAGVDAPVSTADVSAAGAAQVQADGVTALPGASAVTTGARMVLQNRDRSTPSSIAQMRSIAARPDYGRLGFSRDFANGAPVVAGGEIQPAQMGRQDVATASDGRRIPVQYAVVDAGSVLTSNTVDGTSNSSYGDSNIPAVRAIAGNGRIAGLQSAYQSGNANAYRQELVQDAALHGIAPEVIAPMAQPVLVRVMPEAAVTADIGDISNTVGNLDLSAVEQANNDGARVSLDALQFSEDGAITDETVRQFVRAMPTAEQGGLLDTNGQPTRQAVDRLSAAVFAKAYGNDGLVRLFSQAQDPEARNVLSALAHVSPKMARLEGAGALDIREVVAQAAEIAVNARRQGIAIAKAAQQMDMAADPDVAVVLDLFAANARSVRPVVEALGRMADLAYTEAAKPAEDMFGAVPRASRADIINQLRPENERASQEALEDSAGRESAPVDAGRQAPEPARPAAPAEAQAGRPAEDAAIPEGLTSYTAEEVTRRQEEAAQAEATAKRAEDAAARAEAAARNAQEIAQRSVAAADTFELGQSGEDSLSGQGGLQFSRRSASGNRLPDVVIGHKLGTLSSHPDYEAAKAGDSMAAARIASDLVDGAMIEAVRQAAGNAELIVPVVSVEATGRNKIPLAVARELADRLGSTAETEIVQADSPKRTNMDGLSRLLNPPVFDGPVTQGAAYVLVDDTVTQGGTFASLASHIRDNGGEVAGVVALTGKQYSAKLEPSSELLQQVRDRFQSVEPAFRSATGYGFDALTESEARYLAKHNDAESVRNRILAAGSERINGGDRGLPEATSRSQGQERAGSVSQRTPAATIRAAITRAYGNLLTRLESKGVVTLTQTQEQAIEAAAQARADKTGGDVAQIKRSLNAAMQGGTDLDIKRSANGAIEGFFDPQTGQSFLIADNLTAESAPGTLMHEVGIHMAADGKLRPLFDRAAQILKLGRSNPFIQRVQSRMDAAGETSGEEAAAYIVTEYENDRASAPASVAKWVQDFTSAVRAWLFNKSVLLKADQLTVADIAAVARANARSMARGDSQGGVQLSQRLRWLWERYADSGNAFRFGNTDGQRSTDIAEVARAFSGDGIELEGFSEFDGAQVGVRIKDAPSHVMQFKVQPGNGPLVIDAMRANGETGQSPGGNAGQRMYQTLFAWAHNQGRQVDADYSLSYPNQLRRTSAMLSSALRFGTVGHFGAVGEEQAVVGWNPDNYAGSIKALAQAELEKVNERIPVFKFLGIDPAKGDVYSRVGPVLESEGERLGYSAPVDGRLGASQQGAGRASNFAELEMRLAAGKKNPRRFDGREQDAVGTPARDADTVGNGASVQGNRLSDSELARYLASTRGGFDAHGVGVSTLKRALITRDHAGTQVPGLLYSKAGNNPPPIPTSAQNNLFTPSQPWHLPEATRTDRLIYELQDGRIDLKRVQEAIAATGKQITEGFDARLAETLLPGRIARRTESFLSAEVKPILESMAKNNVSQNELSDYLLARHAPERNAQIAKVNDELPDGGAGTNSQGVLMTTQAARDHIAALTAGKRTVLELLANRVDELTRGTREILVREGLEKQETVDAWTGAYQHYVPLFKDEAMETPGHPIGAGMSVTGTASKRATGSTGEVTNMLAHILMQREAAITRAEKNRVAMSLYGLALTNPNSDMWTTIRPSMPSDQIANELVRMGVDPMEAEVGMQGVPTIRGVDPVSGKVVDRPNPMYKRLDNALVVKVNGEDRVILFNASNERAVRLVQNLKNQDGLLGQLDIAGSIVGKATRYFASINTQYNPAFGMVNIIRDVGGAMVNLTDTALAGKQARVLSDSIPAMVGIARDLRGDAQRTPWSDLWQQFQDDGGRTGYRDLFIDPYKRADAVQSELDKLGKEGKLTPGAVAHAVLDLLDDFNTTLENGVRLAAYKAALDQGMSRAEAARLARELTLDFNRKGRLGRELGPLFAFFNASVQGTARTLKALKGPAGAKILIGGLSLGVIQALLLSMAGFDDDEIPEFVKARAFIIPLPGKQYITIPLQFGLNALPNTGRVVTELLMSGGKNWGEKSFNALGELAGSFNPLGGGNIFTGAGALKTIAPTVIDPIVDMATNTDFTGKPIGKERMPWDTRPGFTMGRESTQRSFTGQAYIGISKAINSVTGGNDFAQGLASPSPEEVRYVFTTLGGGVFRELEKALNASVLTAQGESLKAREVPFGSRFAGEVDDEDLQRIRYFKNTSQIDKLEAQLKGLSKEGRSKEQAKLIDDNPLVRLHKLNNEVRRDITKLNKQASESINDKEALKRIDAARTTYMRELNDKVLEMEKAGEN